MGGSTLLPIDGVPQWLRYNRFIRSGYRPAASVATTAMTAFSWHNETVNVWTHLVPAVAFLLYVSQLSHDVTTPTLRLAMASFVGIFMMSVVYHLFMPCPRSRQGYVRLLSCDVLGTLFSITVSSFSFVWYGDRCTPRLTVTAVGAVLAVSCLVVVWAVVASSMTAPRRFAVFGAHCLLRLLVSLYLLLPLARRTGDYSSLTAHTTSFAVLCVGGLINAARVPERWLPEVRAIDFIGNSHNVWHLTCVLSAWIASLGFFYDLEGWTAYPCPN